MQIFVSNAKRKKLLDYILNHPEEKIMPTKIAKMLKLNAGFVSIFVRKLEENGWVKKKHIDLSCPIVRAMKIAYNIEKLASVGESIRKMLGAEGVGVYGSWLHGSNAEKSDVDLWATVKVRPQDLKIAQIRADIRKRLGTEPSFLILTHKKLEMLRGENPPLYFAIINSFVLAGDEIDKH